MPYKTRTRYHRLCFLYASLLVALLFVLAAPLRADTITGTIKDPSGAVIAAARIEITGGTLSQPLVLTSDSSGKFAAPNLQPGKYSIRVSKDGFDDLTTTVDLQGSADLPLTLTITAQQTTVTVTGKAAAFANSDPAYRQLRDAGLGDTYRVENVTLPWDVGTFQLKSGTLTLFALVNRFETGAIFVGQGHFTLKPLATLDVTELTRRSGAPTAEEDFTEVVFRFTPGEYPKFAPALSAKTDTPPEAATAFQHWKEKVRHRHEVPEGLTQEFLESESIDNVDADVLAAIYNPKHPPFLNAYMRGSPHKDLRFFVRARVGALSQMDSPEEVALINCNGGAMDDGIWYSQHLKSELLDGSASSRQDRRLFATRSYNIETVIAKNGHLYSRATITFEPLVPGERVLKFALLPTLRVLRVAGEKGQDLHFIQESRKEDGSFYAVLDQVPPMGQPTSITVEYVGDKVLYDAGGGSYYVGARESWYPNLNGFGEKALYALSGMSPGSMTKYALDQARAQMQLCTFYFGKGPYENVYITEQPNFNFGQSWPNLVYLPISAYIDSTQRWLLFGQIDAKFTGFVQEVTPHEVAHQWFGHAVGWASYHDQWLSEGFAEFAAGLFLQQAVGPKWQKDYIAFWERQRTRILDKNNFGVSPNDAGPLWLGIRLISPRSEQAYQGVTYSKGAYVLAMLRSIMRSEAGASGDQDQAFIDMMHEFISAHRDTSASTESFKTIAEKHMTKQMDLQQNGRLDWFFREWVMGTQVPRYNFKYEVQQADPGHFKIRAEITQSEVDQNFAMLVPVYADFGNGMVRLGQVAIAGNATRTVIFNLDRQPKKVALNAYKEILER